MMSTVLAIDTDPGIDDALALMLAFRHPRARVELVTTVAGNVRLSVATANARRLLGLLDRDARCVLARGSAKPLTGRLRTATHVHGSDGLGGLTQYAGTPQAEASAQALSRPGPVARADAVARLIALAALHGPALTIVALGPLTNLALAIARDRAVMATVGRIVIMGGAINVPGNVTPAAEFNAWVDPLAADQVLAAGIATTLVPLDITHQVRLRPAQVAKRTGSSDSSINALVHDLIGKGLGGRWITEGMPLHDPLAVAVALEPNLVRTTAMAVQVETDGKYTLGMTLTDRRQGISTVPSRPLIDVALSVDAPAALDCFSRYVLGNSSAPKAGHRKRPLGVTVLGAANLDYVVTATRLPAPGETVLGQDLYTGFGGKGANQAVAARRAGASVNFVTMLGNDEAGGQYRQALAKHGIALHEPPRSTAAPSGAALICVDRKGENQIAVAPGANAHLRWSDEPDTRALLEASRVLLAQCEVPIATVAAAFAAARNKGLTTILNASPVTRLPAALMRDIDVLVVNQVEAATICSATTPTGQSPRRLLRALQDLGFSTVVLTLGGRGAIWIDASGIGTQASFKVKVVDTTGAGDTFAGYLASALAAGVKLADAVRLSAAASALAITKIGAQGAIPSRRAVKARWGV